MIFSIKQFLSLPSLNGYKALASTFILALSINGLVANYVIAKEQKFADQTHDSQSKPANRANHHDISHHGSKHPRLRGPMVAIDQLDIDPKKRAIAKQIITEQHQKRVQLHQKLRQSRQNERQQMGEIHQQTLDRLSAVLSPEQVKQFEQLLGQKKPAQAPHHTGYTKGGSFKAENKQQ